MSQLNEIRAASAKFYAALNSMVAGDAAPMADAWLSSPDASAQHPIGGRDQGYESVIASFGKVANIAEGGDIRLLDQKLVVGSDMAVETGLERGTLVIAGHKAGIDHRVTNVYLRSNGAWKVVHHHTDMSENMLDILRLLSEPA